MRILFGDEARQNNLNDFERAVVRRVRAWAMVFCLALRGMTTDKDGFIGRLRVGLSVQSAVVCCDPRSVVRRVRTSATAVFVPQIEEE